MAKHSRGNLSLNNSETQEIKKRNGGEVRIFIFFERKQKLNNFTSWRIMDISVSREDALALCLTGVSDIETVCLKCLILLHRKYYFHSGNFLCSLSFHLCLWVFEKHCYSCAEHYFEKVKQYCASVPYSGRHIGNYLF